MLSNIRSDGHVRLRNTGDPTGERDPMAGFRSTLSLPASVACLETHRRSMFQAERLLNPCQLKNVSLPLCIFQDPSFCSCQRTSTRHCFFLCGKSHPTRLRTMFSYTKLTDNDNNLLLTNLRPFVCRTRKCAVRKFRVCFDIEWSKEIVT